MTISIIWLHSFLKQTKILLLKKLIKSFTFVDGYQCLELSSDIFETVCFLHDGFYSNIFLSHSRLVWSTVAPQGYFFSHFLIQLSLFSSFLRFSTLISLGSLQYTCRPLQALVKCLILRNNYFVFLFFMGYLKWAFYFLQDLEKINCFSNLTSVAYLSCLLLFLEFLLFLIAMFG